MEALSPAENATMTTKPRREDTIVFYNELGRKITITIKALVGAIDIAIVGPDSKMTNRITRMEAVELHHSLGSIIRASTTEGA